MAGPFYEDWEVEEELETPGRTVSGADVVGAVGMVSEWERDFKA